MSDTKSVGPAFPVAADPDAQNEAWSSMPLREYLAAHAPSDIPDWFRYTHPVACPTLPSASDELPDELLTQGKGHGDWLSDADVAPAVVAFSKRFREAQEAVEIWKRANAAGCYFAWRWHYADEMLAARGAA